MLGPLATYPEPHCYDLCTEHARSLTVPRGWQVLRLELPEAPRLAPDELSALADAVSEPRRAAEPEHRADNGSSSSTGLGRTAPSPMEPPADAAAGRTPLRILREPR